MSATINMTVSTEASPSGVVRSVTNISVNGGTGAAIAAPAAAAAAAPFPKAMGNGRLIAGHYFRFKSTADRDAFNDAIVQITALTNAKGGKSFVYNMDTAPTELTMVFVWDSAASFIITEGLFGSTDVVTAMVASGSVTCDAYFGGALTAETRALVAKWNEVPGFDIRCCDNEVAYFDNAWTGMPHDGMGAYGIFTHASEAARDEYLAELKHTAPAWMCRTDVLSHAKVGGSPTKSFHVWFFKSKADTLSFLHEEIPSKFMEKAIGMIPGMISFGGTCFGNTNDPEIKAGLVPWTTWPTAPIISGSLGGASYTFLQRAVFVDTAARDKCVASFRATKLGGDHGGAYWACPVGDSQMWFAHKAKSQADNKAVQAGFVADPPLLASYFDGDITHLPTYFAGNVQSEWMTDMAGWEDNISALYDTGAPLVIHREGSSFGPNCLAVVQEITFNDAAGYDAFIDVQMDPAIRNEKIVHDLSVWKTSAKTAVSLYVFGSSDEWLACNANFTPHAEALGKAIKKVVCHISGPVSAPAKAAIDAWQSASWTDMRMVDRVGRMGK